jgi:hypothetical protein
LLARDSFADSRVPLGRRHDIHVDAAGDDDAAHMIFPSEFPIKQ